MRDLMQLSLPFGPQPESFQVFDIKRAEQAMRARVLSHCWQVENGHQQFADILPPSLEDFKTVENILSADPEIYGQYYRETIESEITRLYKRPVERPDGEPTSQKGPNSTKISPLASTDTTLVLGPRTTGAKVDYRDIRSREELAQNVHVTQLSQLKQLTRV